MAAANNSERGWQVGKTLKECNSYMFDNGVASDIRFSVQTPDGGVVIIPAHKYMLISRSPVFEAMLCGPGDYSESAGDVVITDIEPPVFKEMLRFVYIEDARVTEDNVLYVLTAARKYMLDGLKQKCVKFLVENIDIGNVCTVFDHAVSQGIKDVIPTCMELMKTKTAEVLQSESFLDMSQSSLSKLLEYDKLSVASEVQILEVCKKWAEHKLTQEGDSSEETICSILGDSLLQVRLCTMTVSDIVKSGFADLVSDKVFKLLYIAALNDIECNNQRENARKQLAEQGYNMEPRNYVPGVSSFTRVTRMSLYGLLRDHTAGVSAAIAFTVSKPIRIYGIAVYSSVKGASHHCYLQVHDGVKNAWTRETSTTMTSDGVELKQDVMLEQPVRLEADVLHAVKVMCVGVPCYRGVGGVKLVDVDGVTFNFNRHPEWWNDTDVTQGQIPDILFQRSQMSKPRLGVLAFVRMGPWNIGI